MADNNFTENFMNNFSSESSEDIKLRLLTSIDKNVQKLVNGGKFQSQSNARDSGYSEYSYRTRQQNNRGPFADHHANSTHFNDRVRSRRGGFADSFERQFMDALGGSRFRQELRGSIENLARQLGVEIDDLGDEVGSVFGRVLSNSMKNSKLGAKFTEIIDNLTGNIFSRQDDISNLIQNLRDNPDADLSFFTDQLRNIDFGEFGNNFVRAGTGMLKVIDKVTFGMGGLAVGLIAVEIVTEGLSQVIGGFSDLLAGFMKAAGRYEQSRQQNIKDAQSRLISDIGVLIKTPFDILTKAANEVYSAWNANIRLITGTQGYNKSDLQDLMAAYAARLQSEGLSNVIPATDLFDNLGKVIQAGLSGNAAVEFAYQATKYNAAIPNQDFFNFVESYSSIAANAIAAGKSEAEALEIANNSLKDFSNSLLYASRDLVGGYSTGLKSADAIYSSAVKISQAARSENINSIASSLLAIQGYVGSIAPDLASNLSDTIYRLATGGNSSEIVALRSLAGINASNTEFLRAFSQNPQGILSNMFANLGRMFTESPDAYMEKAEGYASLFGLSVEAFQRIDFQSLANAIINMSDSSNRLYDNLKLLSEGESTTSSDQLKIAQINKYMIEEGLAYVIDNEAAQMIQQHMWDEQEAREMREATYGAELVGDTAAAIEKIIGGIEMIINLLNPIAWLQKLGDIARTVDEGFDLQADVKSLLEATVVGEGNIRDLYNLTARNMDLNLTQPLVEMLGGTARYGNSWYNNSKWGNFLNTFGHPLYSLYDAGRAIFYDERVGGASNAINGVRPDYKLPSSRYIWGSISKSISEAASQFLSSGVSAEVSDQVVNNVTKTVSASVANVRDKIDEMLSDEYLMDKYVNKGKSYKDWRASAKDFGITDIDEALSQSGYSPDNVATYFRDKQVQAGMTEKMEQANQEQEFRQAGIDFWKTRFWQDFQVPVVNKLDSIIQGQSDWKSFFNTAWIEESWKSEFTGESGLFTKFLTMFTQRFIERTYYNTGYSYDDVLSIQNKESAEKGEAIYALAEALTGNMVDLRDPQLQTNAILAQILIVVSAIMNQNNTSVGTVSLADSLSSLAIGLTSKTPITDNPLVNPLAWKT